tara:strand:- start:1302 stop:1550 length:249 start_codon:yes stop_codon:yes gene_type:complete
LTEFNEECINAVDLALSGKWDEAHKIVQEINTDLAQWIHAVLHKIEGDVNNSRYWYSRSGLKTYEDYIDPDKELLIIKKNLL